MLYFFKKNSPCFFCTFPKSTVCGATTSISSTFFSLPITHVFGSSKVDH